MIPQICCYEEMRTMTTILTVKTDAKGRLTIPRPLREELGIEPGDTFFLEVDNVRGVLHFAKAENPFDLLAEHALREYHAGRTKSLRDFANENDIALDDE
jgi:AbrB family looped-hinge helix DNA binding protein